MSIKNKNNFKVIAIIAAYNEGDVISYVIGELINQGISVYLIDHSSTDDTISQAIHWLGKGLLHIEKFPEDAGYPNDGKKMFTADLFRRKEELALSLNADWFIHVDADELRESPIPGMKLSTAIKIVDFLGFNAINFTVFNFRPINDNYRNGDDLKKTFLYYEVGEKFNWTQIKAWKKTACPIELYSSGGHSVKFEGRRVFPFKFILRHYPLRNSNQAKRKIFQDRKPRFLSSEKEKKWHCQYDSITQDSNFIYNKKNLKKYNMFNATLTVLYVSILDILRYIFEKFARLFHQTTGNDSF